MRLHDLAPCPLVPAGPGLEVKLSYFKQLGRAAAERVLNSHIDVDPINAFGRASAPR